jgi:hypothetical protein
MVGETSTRYRRLNANKTPVVHAALVYLTLRKRDCVDLHHPNKLANQEKTPVIFNKLQKIQKEFDRIGFSAYTAPALF